MTHPEGVRLLMEFGPFKQLSEALEELTKVIFYIKFIYYMNIFFSYGFLTYLLSIIINYKIIIKIYHRLQLLQAIVNQLIIYLMSVD